MIKGREKMKKDLIILLSIFFSLISYGEEERYPPPIVINKEGSFLWKKEIIVKVSNSVEDTTKEEENVIYSIINGKRYIIERDFYPWGDTFPIVVSPDGRYIFYARKDTSCGFEGDGATVYKADIFGKEKEIILSRCNNIYPEFVIEYKKRPYLIIKEGSSATLSQESFWIYDIEKGFMRAHILGEIRKLKDGRFKYGVYNEAEEFIPKATVSVKDLVKRKKSFILLKDYILGYTKKREVKVFEVEEAMGCQLANIEKPIFVIKGRGEKVMIVETCRDMEDSKIKDGFLIVYKGGIGLVKKTDIKPVRVGRRYRK